MSEIIEIHDFEQWIQSKSGIKLFLHENGFTFFLKQGIQKLEKHGDWGYALVTHSSDKTHIKL